jgi:transglutaminase-like putative cysteine protease
LDVKRASPLEAPPARGHDDPIRRFFEFSLLGMLASGYAALVSAGLQGARTLDIVMFALAGTALVARVAMVASRRRWRVPERAVTLATLTYLLFYPVDYIWLSGGILPATLHLVCYVAAVKILTAERTRDYFLLKLVALLELLAASVLSTGVAYFICLVVFLVCTLATLSSHELLRAAARGRVVARAGDRLAPRLRWMLGGAVATTLALTLVLFFLLPRTARAALERLLPGGARLSGFASEVTLGQLGEVRPSGAAMLHVNFGRTRPPQGLKWRGTALAEFNGWKWFNSRAEGLPLRPAQGLLKLQDDDELRRPARRVSYEVVLHSTGTDTLFVAGTAEYLRVPAGLVLEMPGGGYRVPAVSSEGFRYVVHAALDGRGGPARLTETERNFHLRLPPVDARVMELARQWTAGARSDSERAGRIEQHLRAEYQYSLHALDHAVDDPLAYFLFEGRRGHCEYFASAMAVLLRAVWVPSRVVTGFQGGSYNELSHWQVVRASDAHSWVEAWVDGQGWTAYDPTPADPNARPAGVASRLTQWLDAAETFWQEWVLSYDVDRQLTLAFRAGESTRRMKADWLRQPWARAGETWQAVEHAPARLWGALMAAATLFGLLWWSWPRLRRWRAVAVERERLKRGQGDAHAASLAYRAMLARLRRRGYTKKPGETAGEFARALPRGPLAARVEEFTACYEALRYGQHQQEARRLAALLEQIEECSK